MALTKNQKAFLDMLAFSELGPALLAVSDNGYNVLVGSTAKTPLLFTSYADHPRFLNRKLKSTAAGRYQILARYYVTYKVLLHLPDFGPASQDAIALQMVREQGALDALAAGKLDQAVALCANIWASLPGAGYGQHENKMDALRQAYTAAGGTLAPLPTPTA